MRGNCVGCGIFARKFLLREAGKVALFAALVITGQVHQALIAQTVPDPAGDWQGTVSAGRGFQILVKIERADQSGGIRWRGVFYSIDSDSGSRKFDVPQIVLYGSTVRFAVAPLGASYEGKLSADSKSLTGTFKQGSVLYPLNLARATPDTAWAIPEATTNMPAGAVPEFDVATIKPTDPQHGSSGFHSDGRNISCDNETVKNIVAFAYGIHAGQIVGGPGWLTTARYDVNGVSDVVGVPNLKQTQGMYRGLLASRFHLILHHEERELSAYAIGIGKEGPKLAKSLGDPGGLPDTTFTEWSSQRITLRVTNGTMQDFVWSLGMTLDRPVVDQTGLAGRFDFVLTWAPEGARGDDPDTPPTLFTGVQEQIGLKIEAKKAPTDVLVIDAAEPPSPN